MRSKLLFLIVLIVALAAFCGTASANLLPNPGMEIDNDPCDGAPDGWWTWGSDLSWAGPSVEEFLEDAAQAHSGDWYGHASAPGPEDYANILHPNEPGVPVEEGKIYYAGIYVKDIRPGGSLTDVGIEFLYWTAAGRDDTYKHVEPAQVLNNGQYNLISAESIPVPVGVVSMVIGFNGLGNSEYNVDDYYLGLTRLAGASGVHSPDPADGATVLPPIGSFPSPITLKWTKFGGQQGDELIIDKVWWNAGSADANENNFEPGVNASELPHTDPNTALATINAEENYYWRVDVIDPNDGNGGAPPPVLIGPVWYFTTVNDPPEVDAGPKQAMWQDGVPNPVTFQLAPTVSDDGLPVPPGSLTYDWDPVAGVIFDPCDPGGGSSDPAPTATMSAIGDYTIQLIVSDGLVQLPSDPCDTVLLRVYENAFTGLLARYDCEENDGEWGIHDDYSGAPRDPCGSTPKDFDYSNGTRRGERMDAVGSIPADLNKNATVMLLDGGHNSTVYPGDIDDTTGVGGIQFNGMSGHVYLANSDSDPNLDSWYPYEDDPYSDPDWTASWADLRDEVTMMAWIKVDPETGWDKSWETIISKGWDSARDDGAYAVWRNGSTGNLQMSVYGVTPRYVNGTAAVNDGEWHHVAGTYDGAEVCVYVDGLIDSCVATDGAQIKLSDAPLTFGESYDPATMATYAPFGGVMDEIRIHSVGLPHRSDQHNGDNEDDENATISIVKIYRDSDGHRNCGGVYLAGDANEDCFVDMFDVKTMAENWLECSSIDRPNCDDYWR